MGVCPRGGPHTAGVRNIWDEGRFYCGKCLQVLPIFSQMDAVYVCRPGENESLRYSLRSLSNVNHGKVWIYGSAPGWIANVTLVERPRVGTKYDTVTAHIKAACQNPMVSDPFMLWNDDFFAVEHVGNLPLLHRGLLIDEIKRFARRHDEWARGLRGTAMLLSDLESGPLLSYELHVPLTVYKDEMLRAIALIEEAGIPSTHRRTVYGNIAGLGGNQIPDPKIGRRWPKGPWVSSSPVTFKTLVLPRLRNLFPAAGPHEIAI